MLDKYAQVFKQSVALQMLLLLTIKTCLNVKHVFFFQCERAVLPRKTTDHKNWQNTRGIQRGIYHILVHFETQISSVDVPLVP